MMQELLQYLFGGITNGAIYAVIALGFSTLYSATDLINFAQGEFVMLGALLLVTLWLNLGLPLPLAFVLVVLAVGLAGIIFERLAIRTVRKPDPIVLVIITVGASIFLRGLGMVGWGRDPLAIPSFFKLDSIEIAGAYLLPQSLFIVITVTVLVAALTFFYKKTLTGKAMSACAINKKAASLLGIGTERMTLMAFALATGLGAVAGVMIAPITMATYDMGSMLGLKGFCAAMLGGLGSLWGALIGGLLLGIAEALGVGFVSSGLKDAIAFLLLLLILYIRPTGILGAKSSHRF
ncbi:branched-chain amino acid ABC transporter permease [Desulfatibacillum aliphaticivorans]|uniref:Inner-membrane translocator n=1 Tax=Desulfatibacillum aliphaticivorans TaxID=218208 RepID=B8FEK1_DESAL|nr:branched-chain amino acid ABC transporter permease [Desulfatibacillum aliphaticivorans]ACL03405.1 inner-membrane translocator [Desulfatibacillum aliphaticivorans]